MTKKWLVISILPNLVLALAVVKSAWAQEVQPDIHVVVNMVQLNIAVTDNKGNYVSGLRPQDFVVAEDGIVEKVATFGEGNEPAHRVLEAADGVSPAEGNSVLVEFTLTAEGDGTRLRVVESGIQALEWAEATVGDVADETR